MMLAMFLQSSREKRRHLDRARLRSQGLKEDIGSGGNISSFGLGLVILGLQEAWTQCFSVP